MAPHQLWNTPEEIVIGGTEPQTVFDTYNDSVHLSDLRDHPEVRGETRIFDEQGDTVAKAEHRWRVSPK